MAMRIGRRTFLGGAAAAIALPALPSLRGAARAAEACQAPRRFLAY
jgi:hypothetical protein